MNQQISRSPLAVSRRNFLVGASAVAAGLTLASCARAPGFLSPSGEAVRESERDRPASGRIVDANLIASATELDLAGTLAATFAYGSVPGPVIRLGLGDTLRARVRNDMQGDTSVHWHGLALRNDMDGVPPLTQDPIAPSSDFVYEFVAGHPGTYWFHPHVGPQLDHGLYGALIVEDPDEPLVYDAEWVVVMDDWLDGVTSTPDEVLDELRSGMGEMGGMGDGNGAPMRMGNTLMGAESALLGGDAGDVYYPHYLINARPPADPHTFTGSAGDRVRIRLINAGSDTAFRFAIGGHRLTITHTDGFPVVPLEADALVIGMGERYDVVVTLESGAFPMVAEAEGKADRAFAVVRTSSGPTPSANAEVRELSGRIPTADQLRAGSSVDLPRREVSRELSLALTGGMARYDWGVNGRRFDPERAFEGALEVSSGERVRLTITNETDMWHPFHLHGHTYQHQGGGPRKDTSIVLPKKSLVVEFDADNPGVWAAHCHNIYHAEAGMMTVVGYLDS